MDCAGAELRISEPGRRFQVTGTCPLVTIEGADLQIEFVDAIADDVIVRGDRIALSVGDIDPVPINAQDNVADAAGRGGGEISGYRNTVDGAGDLGAATIGGNENRVTADSVNAVTVSGSGNQVGPR